MFRTLGNLHRPPSCAGPSPCRMSCVAQRTTRRTAPVVRVQEMESTAQLTMQELVSLRASLQKQLDDAVAKEEYSVAARLKAELSALVARDPVTRAQEGKPSGSRHCKALVRATQIICYSVQQHIIMYDYYCVCADSGQWPVGPTAHGSWCTGWLT